MAGAGWLPVTTADRLIGLAFIGPAIVGAALYGLVLRRRGRRRPWALVAGVVTMGLGLLVPFLPVALAGAGLVAIDVYESHLRAPARPRSLSSHRAGRSRGKYRNRTWLRMHLPHVLAERISKGPRDCLAHEWYRSEGTTWHCCHCVVGIRTELVEQDVSFPDG